MSAPTQIGPIPQQYAAAATVPLVKSPALWLPSRVEMPNDIHPLPDDITAYFVYPFTLETHVVGLTPPPHVAISEKRARAAAVLHAREVEEEQRERDALHKLAPGYNPSSLLVPTARGGAAPAAGALQPSSSAAGAPAAAAAPDPMDELVAQLEELENHKS